MKLLELLGFVYCKKHKKWNSFMMPVGCLKCWDKSLDDWMNGRILK